VKAAQAYVQNNARSFRPGDLFVCYKYSGIITAFSTEVYAFGMFTVPIHLSQYPNVRRLTITLHDLDLDDNAVKHPYLDELDEHDFRGISGIPHILKYRGLEEVMLEASTPTETRKPSNEEQERRYFANVHRLETYIKSHIKKPKSLAKPSPPMTWLYHGSDVSSPGWQPEVEQPSPPVLVQSNGSRSASFGLSTAPLPYEREPWKQDSEQHRYPLPYCHGISEASQPSAP
jgi:hypothetical protein